MGIYRWLRLHNKSNRAMRGELRKITALPEESRMDRLGSVLHHFCVENAADFVQEQLRRGSSSHFSGLDQGCFFHEMLILNYWLVDRVMGGKSKDLLDEIRKQYLLSFHHLSCAKSAHDLSHVTERFAAFNDTWDDVSGHQDVFAEKFAEYLFAGHKDVSVPSVAFWVITHAYEVEKKIRDFKAICRELHVRTKRPTKVGTPEGTRA